MIAIGCDHTSIAYKQHIIKHLTARGFQVKDFGPYDDKNKVDYPDFAGFVSRAVLDGTCKTGILICGTGIGMSIAANKIDGIRCAHCCDTFSARMAKEHNNANIIALGVNITGIGVCTDIVDSFLNTEFSKEERHQKRIDKISLIEKDR